LLERVANHHFVQPLEVAFHALDPPRPAGERKSVSERKIRNRHVVQCCEAVVRDGPRYMSREFWRQPVRRATWTLEHGELVAQRRPRQGGWINQVAGRTATAGSEELATQDHQG